MWQGETRRHQVWQEVVVHHDEQHTGGTAQGSTREEQEWRLQLGIEIVVARHKLRVELLVELLIHMN